MSIPNLGNFPHTIGNLDDRPNLSGAEMKAKLEKDVMVLWGTLAEAIPLINDILPASRLVDIVNHSSTDSGVPTAKAVYDAITAAFVGDEHEVAEQIITAWLNDHPEATTTVTDGSITNAKLASSFITPGVASAYSSSATYAVGDYVYYNKTLYRCITAITTAEPWTPAHWTEAVLGDDTKNIVTGINGVDLYNMLPLYGSFADSTLNGVTWKWNKEHTKCTVNGPASAASYNNFLVSLYDLLCFKAGETYHFNVISSDMANLSLQIFFVYNGTIDISNPVYLARQSDITIPDLATGIVIRVGCASGVTYSNATIEVGVDNKLIPILYPSGTTNSRGVEISRRLSLFGYCLLAAGDFYLDAPVTMPANCSLIGTSKNSRIIKSSHTNLGMFIVNGTTQNVTFRDITFVGTNTDRPDSEVAVGEIAISLFGYAGYVTVDNCAFYGLERAGIYTESGYDWVRCLDVSNCNFLFCGKGIEFAIHGEFSRVSNSHFNACYYGVVNQGGNNCFSCCGFDGCYTGMLLYDSAETPTNDGHGSCVASTFNHCDSYSIVATNIDNGYVFDACEIFFGGVYISNSTGIRFSNCQLRGESETPINVTNSTLVVVDDCIFARSPAVFNVSDTSRFIKRNCYYLDGTDVE